MLAPHPVLLAHPRVEDWPRVIGPLYDLLAKAAGESLKELAVERPWTLRALARQAVRGLSPAGPFSASFQRFLETGLFSTAPLVKFPPGGSGGAVDVLLRCGPGAVLTQPQHFYSVFYRQCTSLAKYARLPSARGRRSWGLAVRRPGEFFCALISRLAADLGIPKDPWEAAAYYRTEGGRRRFPQPLASWLYFCERGSLPEADYLLGRLKGVVAEPPLRLYALVISKAVEHCPSAPLLDINKSRFPYVSEH
ncbi:MAG: hypothetical protein QXF78_05900 [Pyrobaculum sp.]